MCYKTLSVKVTTAIRRVRALVKYICVISLYFTHIYGYLKLFIDSISSRTLSQSYSINSLRRIIKQSWYVEKRVSVIRRCWNEHCIHATHQRAIRQYRSFLFNLFVQVMSKHVNQNLLWKVLDKVLIDALIIFHEFLIH